MEALAQSLAITYTFAKKTLTAPEVDAAHKQVRGRIRHDETVRYGFEPRGARYLLTTQRAIICRQGFFGGVKLRVFGLHPGMTEEVQQDRFGRGHLVFDYTDYAVNGDHLPIGFLWLRDVNATLEVLNGLLETASPEQAIEHAEEEDLPQQSNRFWQKMIVVIVCFAVGVFSLIRGIVHALALQQNADAERWLGALLPSIVGLIFVGGGIAALCSRR